MREHFLRSLEYDLWANRAWLPFLNSAPEPDPLVAVMSHVVWAGGTWLGRCGIALENSESFEASLVIQHDAWRRVIEEDDVERVVEYRNLKGVPMARRLDEILWHLFNHATYHRGQMRGIAEAQGAGWPETDVVLYLQEVR